MKVLHVIPGIAPRYGGPTQAVIGMCRATQREGIECLIATTDANGHGSLDVKLGHPVPYLGTSVIFFKRQWSEAFKYSHPLAKWLENNVINFDVVHIHAIFSHSSVAAARSCLKNNIPYVLRPLGNLAPWSLSQKPVRKRIFLNLVGLNLLKKASAIHYTSETERKQAESRFGFKNGAVIPIGIDETLFKDSFPTESEPPEKSSNDFSYIIFLSRVHPQKGIEFLLKAFHKISNEKKFENWRLIIAGNGERTYFSQVQETVHKYQLSHRVIFTGWLEGKKKIECLRKASLMVLPSHQENFGIAVIEAMALGVPVLISRNVDLAHEIEQVRAGWITELNEHDLGDKLMLALEDKDERDRRGRSGFKLVQSKFQWKTIASDLVGLYHRVSEAKEASLSK